MVKYLRRHVGKFWATVTLLSVELIVALLIFVSALYVFILVARTIFVSKNYHFDDKAFNFLSRYVSDVNTSVMQFFSFLGTHIFLIPANISLVLYFLFIRKHRWFSIKIPAIALSSMLLMFFLKRVFDRQRPLSPLLQEAKGLSFPSGHAMVSFSFYGLLIWLAWTNVKNPVVKWLLAITLSLTILMIGVSRIYLRVHFASDVLAGFCLGLMWLLLSVWILNYMEKMSQQQLDNPEPAVGDQQLEKVV